MLPAYCSNARGESSFVLHSNLVFVLREAVCLVALWDYATERRSNGNSGIHFP